MSQDARNRVIVVATMLLLGAIAGFDVYRSERGRPPAHTCSYRETGSSLIIECPIPKP